MENIINNAETQSEETLDQTPAYIKMDFSLETTEARKEKVEEIIANTPIEKLTPTYLEKLADYLIFNMDKEEKKKKFILTDNRLVTVNKRETSFEGLVGKLENGEDGIYNMITDDKNIIFAPKVSITEEDIENIPGLKELRKEIEKIEKACKTARGQRAFLLRKQLIEMRQDQYVLKNSYKKPIYLMNITKSLSKIDLSEEVGLNEKNEVFSTGLINLYDPKHISCLLCNYSKLKEDCWGHFDNDWWYLMEDFDNLI
jgi:hypothetical protein